MKTNFSITTLSCILIFVVAPLSAQTTNQEQAAQSVKQDTLSIAEPTISDTTSSARIFLDKIEVLGTVAKPQALFILPGSDPTIEGLSIDRSFFKEIFRPVQWDDLKKNPSPSREKLRW